MAEAYAVSYDLRLFLGAPSDFLGLRVGLAFAFAAFFALAGSGLEDSLALGSGPGTGGTSPDMVGMPRRRAAFASTMGAAAGRLSAARAAPGVTAAIRVFSLFL